MSQLVVLKTFTDGMEAEVVRGMLEAHGIFAHISRDDLGGTRLDLNMISGVKLMVPSESLDQAMELLKAELGSMDMPEVSVEQPIPPSQESTYADKALKSALISIVIPVIPVLFSLFYMALALRDDSAQDDRQLGKLGIALLLNISVMAALVIAWGVLPRG